MRYFYFIIVFSFSWNAMAQDFSREAVETLTATTCECIKQEDTSQLTSITDVEKLLGACMLKEMGKDLEYYETQGINADNLQSFENFAEAVGQQLAFKCPKVVDLLVLFDEEMSDSNQVQLQNITGKIQEVEKGTFPIFKIVDVNGRNHNILWLTMVENPAVFEEALEGKKNFILEYYETELYDSRIEEYRMMKVLNAVTEVN
jgi:hypothetical protein